MKVAILGSGNGGCATAFDWAYNGHDVYLFDFEEFDENIKAINQLGGIHCEGDLEGFAEIKYAGHNLEKTLENAQLIFVVGPAYSTAAFGKACKAYLKKGQKIVINPSSCGGSIVFKNELGLSLDDTDYIVAETSTLPYAVRITKPGHINIFLKLVAGVYVSALPSQNTAEIISILSELYDGLIPAKNVLQTTLQNANPIIHPSVTLLNAALIERTKGDFYFYEDGVTTSVGRLIKKLDDERIKIGKEFGFHIERDPVLGKKQGYMADETYDIGYSNAPGFKGIDAQSELNHRYFNEDVGYGLNLMSEFGDMLNIDTPTMDSMIQIISIAMDKDYKKEGKRTLKTLKLDRYNKDELLSLL